MPRPKKPVSLTTANDAELTNVIPHLTQLIMSISPLYPGFPALTLHDKLQNDNWDLSPHEQQFLYAGIEMLSILSNELRLNNTSSFKSKIEQKIELAQAQNSL